MSLVLVLHDLGDVAGRDGWLAAAPDATWEILEQPGHGVAPPPRTGAYDPSAVLTLARWRVAHHGIDASVVVGVGENGLAATLLAAGGGCGALVVVDGLFGPWSDAATRVDEVYEGIRRLLADPPALAPPPAGAVDPRTHHGYGVTATPRLLRPFWGVVAVPTLLIETPASVTPPDDRAERASWFGGPTTLVEAPDAAPATLIGVIGDWLSL